MLVPMPTIARFLSQNVHDLAWNQINWSNCKPLSSILSLSTLRMAFEIVLELQNPRLHSSADTKPLALHSPIHMPLPTSNDSELQNLQKSGDFPAARIHHAHLALLTRFRRRCAVHRVCTLGQPPISSAQPITRFLHVSHFTRIANTLSCIQAPS